MNECSKSIQRRLSDSRFVRRFFVGEGLDIGGKPDPLIIHKELFPLMTGCKVWDLEDGDAQFLEDVENETYDFIHSSHCLEHLHDPFEGLKNWFRVVKQGGYIVITVPDEDLYEQGEFPSTYNTDHKWTFTICKKDSWSPKSINLVDMIKHFQRIVTVYKLEVLDETFRYMLPRVDQTAKSIAESAIEIIFRKRNI